MGNLIGNDQVSEALELAMTLVDDKDILYRQQLELANSLLNKEFSYSVTSAAILSNICDNSQLSLKTIREHGFSDYVIKMVQTLVRADRPLFQYLIDLINDNTLVEVKIEMISLQLNVKNLASYQNLHRDQKQEYVDGFLPEWMFLTNGEMEEFENNTRIRLHLHRIGKSSNSQQRNDAINDLLGDNVLRLV